MKWTRRFFVNIFLGTSTGALVSSILYPILKFLKPPEIAEAQPNSIVVGTTADFKANSGKIVRFGREPIIVIRTVQGDIRAFSAICTHLSCIVQYREDLKHIWCACHNGHYDLTGKNIAGPPPRPLPVFKVNIKAEKIYISKKT